MIVAPVKAIYILSRRSISCHTGISNKRAEIFPLLVQSVWRNQYRPTLSFVNVARLRYMYISCCACSFQIDEKGSDIRTYVRIKYVFTSDKVAVKEVFKKKIHIFTSAEGKIDCTTGTFNAYSYNKAVPSKRLNIRHFSYVVHMVHGLATWRWGGTVLFRVINVFAHLSCQRVRLVLL